MKLNIVLKMGSCGNMSIRGVNLISRQYFPIVFEIVAQSSMKLVHEGRKRG